MKIIVKAVAALMSGGWYAFIGCFGAFLGEAEADVWKSVLDYTYFDADNGYFKDYPERRGESLVKRIWRVMKS